MDKIHLDGMKFYGYHGVFPEENRLGQRFEVSVSMNMSLREAGLTDDLALTVNYAEVYDKVREIVEGPPVKLIEAVAENIASMLLDTYTIINEITVKVLKPHPPVRLEFQGVTVEIQRKRA